MGSSGTSKVFFFLLQGEFKKGLIVAKIKNNILKVDSFNF